MNMKDLTLTVEAITSAARDIAGSTGHVVAWGPEHMHRFERVAACVNACAGLDSAGLEAFGTGGVRVALDTLGEANAKLGRDLELAKDVGRLAASAAEAGIEAVRLELDMAQDRIAALSFMVQSLLPLAENWTEDLGARLESGAVTSERADELRQQEGAAAELLESARSLVAELAPGEEAPVVLVMSPAHAASVKACLNWACDDLSTATIGPGDDEWNDYERTKTVRDELTRRGVKGSGE